MRKPYAVAWAFVLLLSLSLIMVLVVLPKQRAEPPVTVMLLVTTTPRALVLAPTRELAQQVVEIDGKFCHIRAGRVRIFV